ncbi:MAG: DUF3108 domain-containing protein [Desulfobacterota bacterium]|nr:DUF3108 domain-containing protein [Thermodesulfobacteriota bacterium]
MAFSTYYMQSIFFGLLLFFICFDAYGVTVVPFSNMPADNGTLTAPSNETVINYKIDFWLIRNAAHGVLRFASHPKWLRVSFEAETQGILRTLAGSRRELMESIMEYNADTRRFRPLSFREEFSHGSTTYVKIINFDYVLDQYTYHFIRNGVKTFSATHRLPNHQVDDLLSFLCNLQNKAYGPVYEGCVLRACVIMKEKPSYVTVTFSAPSKKPPLPSCCHYVILSMERDITNARSGRIRGWLSPALIPVAGIVEDAYFFGDLTITSIE